MIDEHSFSVRQSEIYGLGLFADQSLLKDIRIPFITNENKLLSREERKSRLSITKDNRFIEVREPTHSDPLCIMDCSVTKNRCFASFANSSIDSEYKPNAKMTLFALGNRKYKINLTIYKGTKIDSEILWKYST